MSLVGALNVAQSSLSAAQAGIQITGNNISNSGNANYARETATLTPNPDQKLSSSVLIGTGVDLTSIQRQVDDALQSRLNNSISDNQSAQTSQQLLTQVQSVFNALGTTNLSTSMSTFFSSWSTLANTPQSVAQRQVVIQQGQALAQQFNSQDQQLSALSGSVAGQLATTVNQADALASQVASLNGQIVVAQGGGSSAANSLLDQRDAVLQQLSQLMNISTIQQPDGSVSVYTGSQPLVAEATSNGIGLQNQNINGVITPTVVFKNNNGAIPLAGGGQLGALSDMQSRIAGVVDQQNTLASNLMFELNKVYSSGQGLTGFTTTAATNPVTDTTQPLNSAAAGLPFTPNNGSFVVHVTDPATGNSTSTLVQVNLTGSSTDSTLDSITASLNAISGVQATDAGGTLRISATGNGQQISFSQDSSGTLAALGINTFFIGHDAGDIAVNSTVAAQPQLLAVSKNGDPTDNQTALSIASLSSQPIAALNGASLDDTYQSLVNGIASQVSAAANSAQAATAVQNTLQTQRDSLSGVNVDDETINLMKLQQQYQGSAQLINVVNQMMTSLLAITV